MARLLDKAVGAVVLVALCLVFAPIIILARARDGLAGRRR
jgi:cell division septation protein DedD